MSGASRGIPFHCPYCGDENLRPSEEGHGAWECHACLRAFSLKMLGMIPRPTLGAGSPGPLDVEVPR
jgi:transposase-like protein